MENAHPDMANFTSKGYSDRMGLISYEKGF
jgi:hypothetical protein